MKTILIAFTGAMALAAAAGAQDITTGHLAVLDANGDGGVDSAEFDAFLAAAFQKVDADGDGYITVIESQAVMTPEQFAAANANGDGGVSREEFTTHSVADFKAADLDGDGVLN